MFKTESLVLRAMSTEVRFDVTRTHSFWDHVGIMLARA